MRSVADWLEILLLYYKFLAYTGQLDLIVPFSSTENVLRLLNFSSADEFRTNERQKWRVDNRIAGYVNQGGNLAHVLVRNAGKSIG